MPLVRLSLLVVLTACNGLTAIERPDLDDLEPIERARVELGRDLFFDAALSGAGDVSCGSCHVPDQYGAEARATSVGTGGRRLSRNAPSVFNASLKRWQFWDGRADTLEEQALGPLFAPDEMGQTEAGLQTYVGQAYEEALQAAFPEGGPVVEQVAAALAAYQRMLPTPSRFDRFLEGDREALDDEERQGLRLFRTNCAFCHGGPGVGGTKLRVLGDDEPWPVDQRQDRGRFEVTGDPDDEMVFVVPSLRNVAQTAPYFHDGSVETLEEAVELMGRHQLGERLPDDEVAALVAFLGTLDAEQIPEWAYPRE